MLRVVIDATEAVNAARDTLCALPNHDNPHYQATLDHLKQTSEKFFADGGKWMNDLDVRNASKEYYESLVKGETPDEAKFLNNLMTDSAPNPPAKPVEGLKLTFFNNNFATSMSDFKDIYRGEQAATTGGKILRGGGALVGIGAGYYFGAKAVRGTKVDVSTGEEMPMGWATRVGNGLLAVASLVGAYGMATLKTSAQRGV